MMKLVSIQVLAAVIYFGGCGGNTSNPQRDVAESLSLAAVGSVSTSDVAAVVTSGRGISVEDLLRLKPKQQRAHPGTKRKLGAATLLTKPSWGQASSAATAGRPLVRRERSDDLPVAAVETSEGHVVSTSFAMEAELASKLTRDLAQLEEFVASIPDETGALCARLEHGLAALRLASTTRRPSILQRVIRSIGLQPTGTRAELSRLYGKDEFKSVLKTGTSLDKSQYIGLQVVPEEFSCLLMKAKNWNVSSVLEIGTGSGWTSTVLATFLSSQPHMVSIARNGGVPIRMHTLDVTDRRIGCVSRVQQALGIRFHEKDSAVVSAVEDLPKQLDLCIFDADRTVEALQSALMDLGNRCRYFVIHGISQDSVPADFAAFWSSTRQRMPDSTDTCVSRKASPGHQVQGTMGFGIMRSLVSQ